jgi:hypothetical protein
VDLYLDSAVLLADDGAGDTAWVTQGGDGSIWLVAGNNEDGYTYQFVAGTGLDQTSWVTTTQYDGEWSQDGAGNYVFDPTGQIPNPPAAPQPVPAGPPPPPQQPVTKSVVLPDGTVIVVGYFPDNNGGFTITISVSYPDGSGFSNVVTVRKARKANPNPNPNQ